MCTELTCASQMPSAGLKAGPGGGQLTTEACREDNISCTPHLRRTEYECHMERTGCNGGAASWQVLPVRSATRRPPELALGVDHCTEYEHLGIPYEHQLQPQTSLSVRCAAQPLRCWLASQPASQPAAKHLGPAGTDLCLGRVRGEGCRQPSQTCNSTPESGSRRWLSHRGRVTAQDQGAREARLMSANGPASRRD